MKSKDMKPLPIKKVLHEKNRLGEIILARKHVLSIYKGTGDESEIYYLTENGNPEIIYMMVSREVWNNIFETEY